jgi:inner membrane protein
MPSPVGHTLAGLCGYLFARRSQPLQKKFNSSPVHWQLVIYAFLANLPDIDVIPGIFLGNPGMFHRQVTHSVLTAICVSIVVAWVVKRLRGNAKYWGLVTLSLYLSHLILDMMLNDPAPPYGIQLFWPLSETYFISPITVFSRFDYFDPQIGIWRSVFSLPNLFTVLREALIMALPIALSWRLAKPQPFKAPPIKKKRLYANLYKN